MGGFKSHPVHFRLNEEGRGRISESSLQSESVPASSSTEPLYELLCCDDPADHWENDTKVKYLALRASQERLPALKVSGDWRTSERAIQVYRKLVAR